MYDPRRYETPLPEWVQFPEDGESNQQTGQDVGTFAALLKKRMAGDGSKGAMPMGGAEGKAAGAGMGGSSSGGGMQSL